LAQRVNHQWNRVRLYRPSLKFRMPSDTTKTPAPASVPALAGLFTDDSGTARCAWCQATPLYRHYHDSEWGFPVADERRLFEKICLEGFQAGLSWLTILNKRETFRSAFANFEAEQVARFDASDTQRLLANTGIVRHAGKIASTINNAQRVLELRREFGSLGAFVWRLEPCRADRPERVTQESVRAMPTSPASVALSKDLKKRGWTFVGPTTMHAFMQAMGLVNDHLEGCASRAAALAARAAFTPPQ
jgi:DNA-3-methyladenine glycosylase I